MHDTPASKPQTERVKDSKVESHRLGSHELLALDARSLAWRRHIVVLAYRIFDVALDAPLGFDSNSKVGELYERITHPQIGDFVYEASTVRNEDPEHQMHSSGILRNITEEPRHSDEVWGEAIAQFEEAHEPVPERPTERVFYVQYGPAEEDVSRWTNAEFRVVPLDLHTF